MGTDRDIVTGERSATLMTRPQKHRVKSDLNKASEEQVDLIRQTVSRKVLLPIYV